MRDARKQITSSGQLELSKAEKAVKAAFKQIEAIKNEDLKEILEVIDDKENA